MMVSLLGSVQQMLQTLFLIRYLVIQPLWATLQASAVYPALNAILDLLAAWGSRDIPLD